MGKTQSVNYFAIKVLEKKINMKIGMFVINDMMLY